METFSTGAALRFGWETFKRRPWFLTGALLLGFVLLMLTNVIKAGPDSGAFLRTIITFLVSLGLSTLVDMGLTAFTLHAHDDVAQVSLRDLWHPQSFWNYLGVSVLTGIIVFVGLILLIVPGIIVMLVYAFVKYLVIDRDLGTIEAMKESARITRGHRLELLLFFLALVGLNILGLLALVVGLFVTIPVSMLAIVHAYRMLASHAGTDASAISV